MYGQTIKTNEQGFLLHLDDWSEEYAEEIARIDNIYLFTDHWELIYYFRDYYTQNLECPTMHQMLIELTPNIKKFHNIFNPFSDNMCVENLYIK